MQSGSSDMGALLIWIQTEKFARDPDPRSRGLPTPALCFDARGLAD